MPQRSTSRAVCLISTAAILCCIAVGGAFGAPLRAKSTAKKPAATSPAVRSEILVEAASGAVLFEKDSHRAAPPASMTKLMLMLLVGEAVQQGTLHWSDPVVASPRACGMGGSQVYLKEGESFTLGEMMQAVIIHSANDAAYAVAEKLAGSSANCVARMNQRAAQLGMHDTTYRSVHGLPPEPGGKPDLSSAADLAVLARQVVRFPELLKWSSTREAPFRGGALLLSNTNRLVHDTTWVDGLKTGYTREAGFNVTATGQRNGLRLIAVVMGAADRKQCFDEAERLLAHGLAEYTAMNAVTLGDVVASDVAVQGGKPRFVRVIAGQSLQVLTRRGEKRKLALELSLQTSLQAPLQARQVVGEVVVKDGTRVVGTVPAVSADAVEKASLWERVF